jgi:phenylpropionate dioxygenase-like ring-hydroxylating dioxygenase large terminal subunit
MSDTEVNTLCETLARYSGQSYDRAWSMPRGFYKDERVLALEIDNLFLREWICVGRAGDYSSFLRTQPDTVDRVRVKMGLIFFGAEWPQERIDWAIDLFQRTMAEDKTVLVALMQGLGSRFQQPGPLARADLEGPTWDSYKYLHRKPGAAMLNGAAR